MAYSRTIRESARRYWLLGQSDEKIVPMLKADFPDEQTPARWHTIADWRKAEDWESDLEIIDRKATEKRQEELATELAAMNTRQIALLNLLDSHTQLLLTTRMVKGDGGKPIDTELSAAEVSQLSSALDRSIKNQRRIRGASTAQAQIDANVRSQEIEIDFKTLTHDQIHRIAEGESPWIVLGLSRQGAR